MSYKNVLYHPRLSGGPRWRQPDVFGWNMSALPRNVVLVDFRKKLSLRSGEAPHNRVVASLPYFPPTEGNR